MPILDNARHERFAQALAQGKTADEAYVEAGYRPNRGNAATLKAKQSIQDRVQELQTRAAADVSITRQWLLEALQDTYQRAKQDATRAAEVAALKEIGTVAGLREETVNQRHEGDVTVEVVSDAPMSMDEWESQYSGE